MKGHFDEIRPGMREIDWIGGELALARIRAVMDELEPELVPCPFCGSPAGLRGVFRYASPCVMVERSRCKCAAPPLAPGFNYLTGEIEVLEECARKAAARWYRRAEATA